MQYVELMYIVPSDTAEAAANALVEAGAGGIEERSAEVDDLPIERPAAGTVALVAWIEPVEVDGFVARAAVKLEPVVGSEAARPSRRQRDEDEWRDAWKRYFHARPIGRFVIVPSWEKYEAKAGEIILDMDPGRAFGTGGHASTRLCLRALDEMGREPTGVLDVGCGSGVLAIAAARRWTALRGTGVDIDPDAVEVSRENAERNHVDDRLRFATTPIERVADPAELVFANIQPEILIPMAPALVAHVAPRGTLILAGIIDAAADSVIAAYAPLGLAGPRVLREEGWTALVYERAP